MQDKTHLTEVLVTGLYLTLACGTEQHDAILSARQRRGTAWAFWSAVAQSRRPGLRRGRAGCIGWHTSVQIICNIMCVQGGAGAARRRERARVGALDGDMVCWGRQEACQQQNQGAQRQKWGLRGWFDSNANWLPLADHDASAESRRGGYSRARGGRPLRARPAPPPRGTACSKRACNFQDNRHQDLEDLATPEGG